MPNPLEAYLIDYIKANGPIDVGQFMAHALGHPQYGYYMKRDPFGLGGDFTTAPEISQMFGEVIGAWVAEVWMRMGSPLFSLVECGPGRGTLMADIMRATKGVTGFHDACSVHLIEMSPTLKDMQAAALDSYTPQWHDSIETLPADRPMILIANEFLDALPVRQFVKVANGWAERMIDHKNDRFEFVLKASDFNVSDAEDGAIFEISPASQSFVSSLSVLLKKVGGAALFIDYGHAQSGFGDTVQALKDHRYVSALEDIGNADVTAHVDFGALKAKVEALGVQVSGITGQGAFLKAIGIETRAAALKTKATPAQAHDIEKALQRLTDSSQMGTLFKVMGLHYGQNFTLPGF